MTKEEMIAFMNANPVMQLATVEGDKPRVRAILLFKADEKGIIFHTANTKDLYKQLMKNPNVEICFNSPDTQLRVTGVAHVDDDLKLREEIFAHPTRKFLQAWKDMGIDNLLTVFRITDCIGTTWTMQTNFNPKEYVEITYRKKLRDEGKLWFLSGKQEFIRLGVFDDIDISVMQHSATRFPGFKAGASSICTGFAGKLINYTGKGAHAGAAPFDGINALNAAMLGLMAVHAQRETFKDVNVVPADVRLETYVRGANTEAIIAASGKVNRAFRSGADAVGAKCEIIELPGYLPVVQCDMLNDMMVREMENTVGEDVMKICPGFGGGSTDQGDVSQIIPSIQSFFAGVTGGLHATDFCLADKELGIITAAKTMLCLVIELLYGDASQAKKVKSEFKPVLTKEEYLRMWGGLE